MSVVSIRLVEATDAPVLAELVSTNRRFMAATDPQRPDEYFTEHGQRADIDDQREAHEQRRLLPYVIMVDDAVVGRVSVTQIFYRAFCSGILGYWVGREHNGRGVASAAVARIVDVAFGPWQLHRLEAGTLVDNVGSQKVLLRNGFERFGLAPRYLHINGAWRDHVLFQRLNELAEPPG